jgi:DNA-directed RNA polymerase subunit RPC12/RpoP
MICIECKRKFTPPKEKKLKVYYYCYTCGRKEFIKESFMKKRQEGRQSLE